MKGAISTIGGQLSVSSKVSSLVVANGRLVVVESGSSHSSPITAPTVWT
jgi:hypothetical protein